MAASAKLTDLGALVSGKIREFIVTGKTLKEFLEDCSCSEAEIVLTAAGVVRVADLLELTPDHLGALALSEPVQDRLNLAIKTATRPKSFRERVVSVTVEKCAIEQWLGVLHIARLLLVGLMTALNLAVPLVLLVSEYRIVSWSCNPVSPTIIAELVPAAAAASARAHANARECAGGVPLAPNYSLPAADELMDPRRGYPPPLLASDPYPPMDYYLRYCDVGDPLGVPAEDAEEGWAPQAVWPGRSLVVWALLLTPLLWLAVEQVRAAIWWPLAHL